MFGGLYMFGENTYDNVEIGFKSKYFLTIPIYLVNKQNGLKIKFYVRTERH